MNLPEHLSQLLAEQENAKATYSPVVYKQRQFVPESECDSDKIVALAEQVTQEVNQLSANAHNQRGNIFHISNRYEKKLLDSRIAVLDELLTWYSRLPLRERDKAQNLLVERFRIAQIPPVLTELIDHLQRERLCDVREGAENKNYLIDQETVIKITKDRHHHDFYSIIKLIRHMHVLYRYLGNYSDDNSLKTEICGEEMFILAGEQGFCRLIIQPFEAGVPVGDLSDEIKVSENFRKAWHCFVECMKKMKKEYQVVLDITDSRAGFKKQRGNVMNTTNVVVEQGTPLVFKIIDPDVFDIAGHKFSSREYFRPSIRNRMGVYQAFLMSFRFIWLNFTRKSFVLRWQDSYMEKSKGDEK